MINIAILNFQCPGITRITILTKISLFASTYLSLIETVFEHFKLRCESYTTRHLAAIFSPSVSLLDLESADISYGKPQCVIRIDPPVDLIEPGLRQDLLATQANILASSCRLGCPQMRAKAKKQHLRKYYEQLVYLPG